MPEGIIVMKYSDKSGITIEAQYPEEKMRLQESTLMHILTLHEFTKEPGTISLTVNKLNLATYYSRSEKNYFIVIKLQTLEDPDEYEDNLSIISNVILENLEDNRYVEMLPSLFEKISIPSKND